jgi:hypothetical protein
MKHSDFLKLIELQYVGNGWVPANENANELSDSSKFGEIHTFTEVMVRDLRFHKCYMSLLSYIYDFLPIKFRDIIPKDKFYVFLKGLKKEYTVMYTFEDGSELIEYDSIAFGSMSQKRFEDYIRMQLPYIYENVIGKFYHGDDYDRILNNIENEFEKFLSKL